MTHKTDKTFLSTLSVHQYMPCFAFLLTVPWQMINHIRTIFADKFPQHFLKRIKLISACLYLSKSSGRIQQLCPDLVRQWQPNEFQGATVKSRNKMTYHRSEVFLIHWYLFLWLYMWNQEDCIHFQNWLLSIDDSWTVACMFYTNVFIQIFSIRKSIVYKGFKNSPI